MNLRPGIEMMKAEERRLRNLALRRLATVIVFAIVIVMLTIKVCMGGAN